MKDFFTVVFGGIVLFLLGPMVMLWAINSLAESGGADFYIEHNLWNYFVAFVMLFLLRARFRSGENKGVRRVKR